MKRISSLNIFGRGARFHHAGFAVRSIVDLVKTATKTTDKTQNVSVAFVRIHDFEAELVEPLGDDSPIGNVLKRQQSLYHLCFEVKNISNAVRAARKHGFHLISSPVPARAFGERRIAWVFSRGYGLIELLEEMKVAAK
jgi:methylmalonyl-CoA/ethylmalonyl-CoA epimerase